MGRLGAQIKKVKKLMTEIAFMEEDEIIGT
jgi:hypothetical protein